MGWPRSLYISLIFPGSVDSAYILHQFNHSYIQNVRFFSYSAHCPAVRQRTGQADPRSGNLFPISANHQYSALTWLQVEEFVEKDCIPADIVFSAQLGEGEQRWKTNPAILESLKEKAKKIGLWNMFLPKNHFSQGAGFSNLEYGLMAELLGKSKIASEVSYSILSGALLYLLGRSCKLIRLIADYCFLSGYQQCCPRYRQHGGVRQVW